MSTHLKNTASSASAKNALKSGVYSNQLLEGEDPQLVQETIDALVRDFHVTTSYGYQLVQDLTQVMLKMNRHERWQCSLIESHMAKYQTRFEFAKHLELDMLGVSKLPDWYFDNCQKSRAKARKVYRAFAELDYLIKNHSADLMQRIKAALPDLWWYVMGTSEATEKVYTFSDRLSQYSKQSEPVLRLRDLKNHLEVKERHEILWAQSESRYEAVLSGLRAQVHMDLTTNPNLQRSEVSLHRKKTDLIAQLMQISRESQTVTISASEHDSGAAQVITYKASETKGDQPQDVHPSLTSKGAPKGKQAPPKA
jgi:hypothetical protein